jgi:hypothetical protein
MSPTDPRPRYLVAGLFLVSLLTPVSQHLAAQEPSAKAISPDAVDLQAYPIFFRRVVTYEKLAAQADKTPLPKPYLRRLVAQRFGLGEFDAASVLKLSVQYENDVLAIHQQRIRAHQRFKTAPFYGSVKPGTDISPTPELTDLANRQDTLTLQYRDLLRNDMNEQDFQKLNVQVRTLFGGGLRTH